MNLFVFDKLDGSFCTLTETDSKHAVKVLRYKQGDIIHAVNGSGTYIEGRVENADSSKCLVAIEKASYDYGKKPYSLHMAVAPTKQIDRFEWFLEKATEIGIDQITPFFSSNSERRVIKPERLNKVIISAMKQSLKAYKPVLNEACSFTELIRQVKINKRYIAHCYDDDKTNLVDAIIPGEEIMIIIGPEGDFSLSEVQEALMKNFKAVSLGDSRLRTETAAIVATHTVELINQMHTSKLKLL
ncbi:MAG: 16S rRNA (uracil(1498)-N(3))-methyltransferase [Bacteroidales bacterium]|nr:16S rRNA (uracil(1498)-N(3))-methyltransferase [Bacteroidales bacterium]